MRLRAAVLAAVCAVSLGGCARPSHPVYQQQLFAFGTLIDITLVDVEPQAAREAVQAIDAMYQRQHRDWHAWQRGQLTALNDAIAAGRSQQVDPSIATLIGLAQRFESLSDGLFNPAIGQLLALWGFQQDAPPSTPPARTAIEQWRTAAPSSLQLSVEGTRVSSSNRSVKLDFGGFAKGYSVAKAVELLQTRGIENLVVNAGGDLCLRGRRGDRPWRIGIRAPDGNGVLASIELEGAHCVFTSGDYERGFDYQGRHYHHILDPRTGYPALHTRSVTVVAGDAALADAAATALFVAGPQDWQAVARSMAVSDVLLVDDKDTAYVTDTLAEQIHFETPPGQLHRVVLTPEEGD